MRQYGEPAAHKTWQPANALPSRKVWPPQPAPHTIAREDVAQAVPALTAALIERGHQRFDIYCSPCHGFLGKGDGMIVQRGFPAPPSFHIDRLRSAPTRHFYEVITNGWGVMYSYADRVADRDRWAIAAYIRALQESRERRSRLPPRGGAGDVEVRGALAVSRPWRPWAEALSALSGLPSIRSAVLRGWLAGWFVFWIGFPVGALMLLLAHDLTGGRWGDAVREPLRAFGGTLPVMALMVVPILVYLPALYPWARAEEAAHLANGFYLNTSFFLARTAVYFAVWMLVAVLAERGRGGGSGVDPAGGDRDLRGFRLGDVDRAGLGIEHLWDADHQRHAAGRVGGGDACGGGG